MATTAAVPPLHNDNHLQNEVTKVEHNNYDRNNTHDLESGLHPHQGANMTGGAPLGRQISVQLTNEQYERLFLQTGGTGGKGDLAKRFGNPTPLGVASFLICLTPFSCELMGWGGTTTAAATPAIGAFCKYLSQAVRCSTLILGLAVLASKILLVESDSISLAFSNGYSVTRSLALYSVHLEGIGEHLPSWPGQ